MNIPKLDKVWVNLGKVLGKVGWNVNIYNNLKSQMLL